jgi:hypothetical protein
MAKVIYAAWDGEVIDNRSKKLFEIEDTPEFAEFGEFDAGNPIKAFVGGKGFFVFEKDVNLLETALSYLRRVAKESCGKCTPCRMGSHILVDYLESLLEGRKPSRELLDEIGVLADHVDSTSLCGIGHDRRRGAAGDAEPLPRGARDEDIGSWQPATARTAARTTSARRASRSARPRSTCRATSTTSRMASSRTRWAWCCRSTRWPRPVAVSACVSAKWPASAPKSTRPSASKCSSASSRISKNT